MGRQHFFLAFVGLLSVEIVVVQSSFFRSNPPREYSDVVYPQRAPLVNRHRQQNNIEIVEGTIDQLNRIDATWVCTNRRTGDQMIFGTEIENGKGMNNEYPQKNTQSYDVRQSPGCNPSQNQPQVQDSVTALPIDQQNQYYLKPTTIEEVRKKWADFDWTQYVTVNPTTMPPSNVPTITPPNGPHAGEGIIEARIGA